MFDANGNPLSQLEKSQEQQIPSQVELHIIWKERGIGVSGNCVKDEMVALYLLDKAKDIIKKINTPQIASAKFNLKSRIMDFVRQKK